MGVYTTGGHANFVYLPEQGRAWRQAFDDAGLRVRHYPDGAVRITVGGRASTRAVLAAMTQRSSLGPTPAVGRGWRRETFPLATDRPQEKERVCRAMRQNAKPQLNPIAIRRRVADPPGGSCGIAA